MHIVQILPSPIRTKNVGKWWCSDSIQVPNNDPIIRYLRKDGTWGRNTEYFDSREELETALALGHKPDFSLCKREIHDRFLMKDMMEHSQRQDDEFYTNSMLEY